MFCSRGVSIDTPLGSIRDTEDTFGSRDFQFLDPGRSRSIPWSDRVYVVLAKPTDFGNVYGHRTHLA